MSGRLLRRRLLLGPDGAWREDLWGAAVLAAADSAAAGPGAAPAGADRTTTRRRPVLTGPLPVNTCSEDSLTLLPGVGPKLAARIAASRRDEGPFRDADDLQRVKGIGPALAARIGPLVVFRPDSVTAAAGAAKSP
ncbi:MAG: helix-hairpin-helix domain-containing protein [Candidatus Krumholzibacteriia bacterium]